MFHRVTDASKVAMVALVQHGLRIGIELIDIQVLTEHTRRMGGVQVSRESYLELLAAAISHPADWYGGSSSR
jgi:leucyl/phenylalanyl-tRNA--protein transferase